MRFRQSPSCRSSRRVAALRRRPGAAATELALTLPFLLLLGFSCVDVGYAVSSYVAVANAARVGAEYGASHGYTEYSESSWRQRIVDETNAEFVGSRCVDPARLDVAVKTAPGQNGIDLVTVECRYRFKTLTLWPAMPDEFDVSRSVTMRRYR
jgi:Flp pilus assembly protein TadG